MKNSLIKTNILLISILLGFSCSNVLPTQHPDPPSGYTSNIFTLSFDPNKSEKAVVDLINNARKSIYVSLYGFDNVPIEDALVDAHRHRGIDIRMVTEYDSERSGSYQRMIKEGIDVHLRNSGGIMHNKYFLIDGEYIVTGSTNLTEGMFQHFNNMILIKSKELVADYMRDFRILRRSITASEKDTYFDTLYGKITGEFYDSTLIKESVNGDDKYRWPTDIERSVGEFKIKAYFTPYRKTFPQYNYPSAYNGDGNLYLIYNYDKALYEEVDYKSALNVIVPLLENATKSITVFTFAFTDRVIIDRMIKANDRGVDVKVYMDYMMYRSQFRHSGATYIQLSKEIKQVKICRKADGGLLHHKVIMIDDRYLILGSLNFSNNAVTNNDENFLVIDNAGSLINAFMREKHRINQYSYLVPDTDEFSGYFDEGGDSNYDFY